jgi:hypothetical protein
MPFGQVATPFHRCISLLAAAGLLTACAQGQFSTRQARIGADDGRDSCRAQLVALDSTGNFFGAQILTGAAIGVAGGALAGGLIGGDWKSALIGAAAGGALGAAGGYWTALQQQSRDQAGMFSQVSADLSRENAQIDRTQLAFDQLVDCRFYQARSIDAAYKARRFDRPTAMARMAEVKHRAQADLALARQIDGQIAGRAEQFEVAADNVAPGARAAIASRAPAPIQTAVRRPAPLKLRPDPAAPDIGQVSPLQVVSATPARGGYVLVQTAGGERGYIPAADVPGVVSRDPTAVAGNDVRSLAGSNAARRDSFSQSVSVSEQAAATGFELAA